jgi:hypothetical protein
LSVKKTRSPRRAVFGAFALAASGLAACSGSGSSPKPVTQANIAANVLQLAVGTANIYGDLAGTGGNLIGTNIVATYRQPAGQFAGDSVLVNSPLLTGPFTLAAPAGNAGADPTSTIVGAAAASPSPALGGGPAPAEIGAGSITSTPQTSGAVTSLGTSGGVSGLGIEPFNYNNQNGVPFTVVPYQVPLYDPLGPADPNGFVPWGGPPAFDPNKDGQGVRDGNIYPNGTLGVSEGLDVFAGITPSVTGPYTLNAPSAATSAGTVAPPPAKFTLKSTALLPAATPPVPTLDGAGGASFAVTLPAGVTQAYVQVTDIGPPVPASGTALTSCNAAQTAFLYYTIVVTGSGVAVLGDRSGDAGNPSICNSAQNTAANSAAADGDQFVVQLVGFDYPAYAISYPNSKGNPAPVLVGAAGQDDITISSAATYAQPAGGVLTRVASHARRTRFGRLR